MTNSLKSNQVLVLYSSQIFAPYMEPRYYLNGVDSNGFTYLTKEVYFNGAHVNINQLSGLLSLVKV